MNLRLARGWIGLGMVVATIAVAAPGSGIWDQLYSSDLKLYADNLRAAGAPPEVVTVVISHEVNARFQERERELQPSTVTARSLRDDYSPSRREALVNLRLEKNALLRAALGHVPEAKAERVWSPRVLARLKDLERSRVQAIVDDYDAMIARVNTEARGHLLDEDREKIRFLEAERGKDLRQVLTEEEVLDYEIAETSFGRSMRSRLRLFEATQEQLRTYLRLAKKNDLAFGPRPLGSAELEKAREAFERDLALAWDPDTYARYRRTTSSHYIWLHNLVRRLGLEEAVARQIFESARRTTEEGSRLFHAANPSQVDDRPRISGYSVVVYQSILYDPTRAKQVAEMSAKLKALADEHAALAKSLLGDAGFKAYIDFAGGWIESMRKGNSVKLDISVNQPEGAPK